MNPNMDKQSRIALVGRNLARLTMSIFAWATENESGGMLEQRKKEIIADLRAIIELIEST